ncbi:MAG: hypothetical protein ACREBV_02760 [Candidatus Zixiibacteriota bacterium]
MINNTALIKYQQFVWISCLAYFSVSCLLLIAQVPLGDFASHLGVKIVLVAAVSQLLVMAYQFRLAGNRRFMYLSYVLLMVIMVASLAGSFLL